MVRELLVLVMVLVALGVGPGIVAPGVAGAVVLAQSTFGVDADGWLVGDFLDSPTATSTPTYVSTGGNPGGFIRTSDVYNWSAYIAPAKFLGNKSLAYGNTLHFDQQSAYSDNTAYSMVALFSGSTVLQYWTSSPATTWTSYDIPLIAASGWEVATARGVHGSAATEAQLQGVLSNLTSLRLLADWHTGADQVDLDNVYLYGVPEPSIGLLIVVGLVPLGIAYRRRRRPGAAR